MELVQGGHKASNFAPKDFISNMPDNVVTNILDRLPLQHAVRTGILSRNWRFKWTMLSQLVLDERFFEYIRKKNVKINCGEIISRLLLHIKGIMEKFVLSVFYAENINDVETINHWILFLSGKGIKDLTLRNMNGTTVRFPSHLFSCLELKHLKLRNCCLSLTASFRGFPNLLSLELSLVQFESSELGDFLTRCPLLETLDLSFLFFTRDLKPVDFANSKNLKILSLALCFLDNVTVSSSTIFELVGFLPKLQVLDLDFVDCKLTEGDAKRRLPTASLKALKLSRIDLDNGIMLSCVFEMITHFPNLQTLEITAGQHGGVLVAIPEVEYNNTTGLRSVVFKELKGSENEVCLIKYLLGGSPFLKETVIRPHYGLVPREQLVFARKLLKFSRASTVAEIVFR